MRNSTTPQVQSVGSAQKKPLTPNELATLSISTVTQLVSPACATENELEETLKQLQTIVDDEGERQKSTDTKLGTAQNAIGFTVTLASGSLLLTFLQSPSFDFWHVVALGVLTLGIGFFVWAGILIVKAYEPVHYQRQTADGVVFELWKTNSKTHLLRQAILDLLSIARWNSHVNTRRLSLYQDALGKLRLGIIFIGLVPATVLIAFLLNTFLRNRLPEWALLGSKSTAVSESSRIMPNGTARVGAPTQPHKAPGPMRSPKVGRP